MQRRTFLRTGVGLVGTGLVAGKSAADGQSGEDQPFEPVGSVDVPGATEAVVHRDDEFVYVAVDDGFAVVDISDPESPSVVAQRREIETGTDAPFRQAWDLWTWENRLILGGPAQYSPGSAFGFALFDISDPEAPEQITFYRTDRSSDGDPHYIHNTHFEDGIVYLTGSGIAEHPLVMIDVSDDDPVEVGRWSIVDDDPSLAEIPFQLRPIHDVYVQNGIAYLPYWDAGTWIVDVSDPGDPELLSRVGHYELDELKSFEASEARIETFVPPGNDHVTTVDEDGSVLAVGEEAWARADGDGLRGGAGGVVLYDVSEKTEPERLARIEAPESFGQTRDEWFTTAHNCDLRGNRLYTSWYFGGVKIHDVSDPGNPEELAWWRNPREASFWTTQSAGDVVVGSSSNVSVKIGSDELNETAGALYVFPDRDGTQPDPPSLTERPADLFGPGSDGGDDEDGNDGADGEEGDDENGSEGSTDDGSDENGSTEPDGTDSEGDANTTGGEDSDDVDSSGPGLGVGSAVAGLGGYYLVSRARDRHRR